MGILFQGFFNHYLHVVSPCGHFSSPGDGAATAPGVWPDAFVFLGVFLCCFRYVSRAWRDPTVGFALSQCDFTGSPLPFWQARAPIKPCGAESALERLAPELRNSVAQYVFIASCRTRPFDSKSVGIWRAQLANNCCLSRCSTVMCSERRQYCRCQNFQVFFFSLYFFHHGDTGCSQCWARRRRTPGATWQILAYLITGGIDFWCKHNYS